MFNLLRTIGEASDENQMGIRTSTSVATVLRGELVNSVEEVEKLNLALYWNIGILLVYTLFSTDINSSI